MSDIENIKVLNNEYKDFIQSWGSESFIKISPPEDSNEIMIKGRCKDNVAKKQIEEGGMCVEGFVFTDLLISDYFYHHTVWEKPDGKLLDVTINRENYFLPIIKYDANKEWYFTNSKFKIKKSNPKLFDLELFQMETQQLPRFILSKNTFLRDVYLFKRSYPKIKCDTYKSYIQEYYSESIAI